MSKELTNLAKQRVDKRASECEDCGGSGLVCAQAQCMFPESKLTDCRIPKNPYCTSPCDCPYAKPCPTCAPLRKMAGELCWHEWIMKPKNNVSSRYSCTCGLVGYDGRDAEKHMDANPTYTIQSLRELLERMGEWEKFVSWLYIKHWVRENDYDAINIFQRTEHADILTSDELIIKAGIEYLKWRV